MQRRTRGSRRAIVALLALSLLGSACSSTERMGNGETIRDGDAPEGPAGKVSAAARKKAAGGTTTPGGVAGPGGVVGEGGVGPPGAVADGATGKIPLGPGVKGITNSTILFGGQTADLAAFSAAAAALGSGASSEGQKADVDKEREAITKYFNDRGGIAGRKIEWVIYKLSTTNAVSKEGRARDAQAACATYTEDNSVFAFMGSNAWTEDNVIQCAINTKTVYVDYQASGANLSERRAAQARSVYYHTARFVAEDRERHLVNGLARQGRLKKGTRVGILYEDEPSSRESLTRALEPAIKAKGGIVASKVAYPDIISSPWNSYVLQFQRANVDLVVFGSSSYNYWPTLNFMRAAEDQAWRPKYGLTSESTYQSQIRDGDPDQLRNVTGIGWVPSEVGDGKVSHGSLHEKECIQVATKAGYPLGSFSRQICEFLFFMKQGLETSTELSQSGFQASVEKMTNFDSIYTFTTKFAPTRHHGAAVVRDVAYDAKCGCFAYTSGEIAVR